MENNFTSAKKTIETAINELKNLLNCLDENFNKAIEEILNCEGRVVVTGLGKSGLVGRKISATLASTGTPSFFLHPSEAFHGDLGMLRKGDIVLALSNSGETEEIVKLVPFLKRLGVKLFSITGNRNSTLAVNSDIHLFAGVSEEGCPLNLAPMASTTVQIALGDAIASELMSRRKFMPEDFAKFHPGGKLGKRFLKVKELMHKGGEIPLAKKESIMKDVIFTISSKKLGVAVISDENDKLFGIITDGDLRRLIEKFGGDLLNKKAEECANPNPKTILEDSLAVEALNIMEEKKITSLVVADEEKNIKGIVHLHDLWKLQLI
ncbi:MAG: KpsF/GutQ family sugar-phosphate isomerase [Acidobacteria bacterium]|nr:KpsF/GutQ family sugar-phosphate isomerase [Acidobacteriota bacterium]